MPEPRHIVALGSSFASGASISPIVDPVTNRSGVSYSNLVSKTLSARLTDLSAAGATLQHVLDTPQQFLGGESRPPQLDGVPSDADIITLTAGGNDMGYSAHMIADAIEASPKDGGNDALDDISEFLRMQLSTAVKPAEVTKRFLAVIDALQQRAPHAAIFLVEYLTIFGTDARANSPSIPFDEAKLQHHVGEAEKLRKAYVDAAKQRSNVTLIQVAQRSAAHGVDAVEPWVKGWAPTMLLRGDAPYHPNARGHEEIAKLLLESIRSTTTRPA